MTVTRNQIYDALLALGTNSGIAFKETGRRLRQFDAAAKPALFQIEPAEDYRTAMGQLRRRVFKATWVIFHNEAEDPNAVPAATTADLLDMLDALFPDSNGPIKQTLGGLVHSVAIDGIVQKFEGDLDSQTVISVPLAITVP